jgi:hypothetical protein
MAFARSMPKPAGRVDLAVAGLARIPAGFFVFGGAAGFDSCVGGHETSHRHSSRRTIWRQDG